MRRIAFRLLVISSALLLVTTAQARTRPRYGDSVRAEVRASAPSYEGAPDLLAGLVFETLVTTDDNGHLAPGLALTWTSPNGGYTWQFALRSGVQFHDGSPLTPLAAATALAKSPIPGCKLRQGGNLVEFACDSPQPNLPAMLSQPRFLIFAIAPNNDAVGTGPFRVEKRDSDRFLLKANDDYWVGRPYSTISTLSAIALLVINWATSRSTVLTLFDSRWINFAARSRTTSASNCRVQLKPCTWS